MLPLFFRHYDGLVDHYFIRDNKSTDGSLDILRAHPRVTILPLFLEGDSMVEAAFAQVNQFWHPSRGQADWVAVCNVDELFWHIDLEWYLRKCQKKGITFLRSRGYQMVGQNFAEPGDNLVRVHRYENRGTRNTTSRPFLTQTLSLTPASKSLGTAVSQKVTWCAQSSMKSFCCTINTSARSMCASVMLN